MRAAVLHGKEDVRIEEVPEFPLHPGEVRVRIHAALTCGTDLKVFRRGYHARMLTPPCTFGHEFSGTISEVHPENPDWHVGDRVVAANSAPCGTCPSCRRHQPNLCDDLLFLNGAYAQSIVIPARITQRNLHRIADSTPFAHAALTEPLACVVQGIHDLRLHPTEHLLILGAGPIGLMAAVLARHHGCQVTLVGRDGPRLDQARALGIDDIRINRASEGIACPDLRPGSFDAVFEAVGKPSVWEATPDLVRKGGRINLFGGCPAQTSVRFDTARLHYSALSLLASFHHTTETIREALRLIESGVIPAPDFINATVPLSHLPAHFQAIATGNQAVKALVDVGS